MRALVLTGSGRYADPWHDFGATSEALAVILEASGADLRIEIDDRVDERLADLDGWDLLVLNVGRQSFADPAADERSAAGLAAFQRRGGALLALHATATSFAGLAGWEEILGGRWVDGVSMHPAQSTAVIATHPERHPIVAGIADFEVFDERYTWLSRSPGRVDLLTHRHDGVTHALAWAFERGDARVVYDALGHDARSYRAEGHRRVLARSTRWLLGELD